MREEWPDRADDNKDQPEREPSRAAHLIAHVLGAGPILDKQQTFFEQEGKNVSVLRYHEQPLRDLQICGTPRNVVTSNDTLCPV